jgi:hypothetical protein
MVVRTTINVCTTEDAIQWCVVSSKDITTPVTSTPGMRGNLQSSFEVSGKFSIDSVLREGIIEGKALSFPTLHESPEQCDSSLIETILTSIQYHPVLFASWWNYQHTHSKHKGCRHAHSLLLSIASGRVPQP